METLDVMNAAARETKRRQSTGQRALLMLLGGCALVLAAYRPADAKTVQVSSTCTLREAVQTVNSQSAATGCTFTTSTPTLPTGCTYPGGSDLILVPSGTYTVPTTADPSAVRNEPIELNRNAWVCGSGVGVSTLRGNSPTSSFFLRAVNNQDPFESPMSVTFENITVSHTTGYAFTTGIYAWQADLNVKKARVVGFGGSGISTYGAYVGIDDSTIENNSSWNSGAGIRFEADPARVTDLNINFSTIANNTSAASGGGIYYAGMGNSDLINVTISGNNAVDGGGIYKEPGSSYLIYWYTTIAYNTATNNGGGIAIPEPVNQGAQLFASLVAQNSAPNGPDIHGIVNWFTDSLIGDSSDTNITHIDHTGITDVWANLDPVLRDLGGPYHTKVHRPLPGSPALDAVMTPPASFPEHAWDQRHVVRPQFAASSASVPDMGAVENTRLESDWLGFQAANATHVAVMDSQASNGWGTNLQADGLNDFVVYSTASALPSGTYKVTIGYKRANNAGRFQFGRSTSSGGPFTSIGGVQEGYATSSSWTTVNLGNVTFPANTRFFRFIVTSKSTSSSGYQIFPDFIELTRQ